MVPIYLAQAVDEGFASILLVLRIEGLNVCLSLWLSAMSYFKMMKQKKTVKIEGETGRQKCENKFGIVPLVSTIKPVISRLYDLGYCISVYNME